MPRADDLREVGDCEVAEIPQSEVPDVVKGNNPELSEAHWPSVTFILANGDTWQSEGPLLEVLDHFLDDGLHLSHVVAIIPTRE